MFKIEADKTGQPVLKYSEERPEHNERGRWVEIGPKDSEGIEQIVRLNRKNGLIVLLDDKGIYRALVLTN